MSEREEEEEPVNANTANATFSPVGKQSRVT